MLFGNMSKARKPPPWLHLVYDMTDEKPKREQMDRAAALASTKGPNKAKKGAPIAQEETQAAQEETQAPGKKTKAKG